MIALAKRTASDLREDALWGALSICKGQGKRKGKGKGIARKGTGIAHKGKGKVHGKQALDWNIDTSDVMAEACRLSEPRE